MNTYHGLTEHDVRWTGIKAGLDLKAILAAKKKARAA
jgi:hypothetical protein